jgi:hypothetical protein
LLPFLARVPLKPVGKLYNRDTETESRAAALKPEKLQGSPIIAGNLF